MTKKDIIKLEHFLSSIELTDLYSKIASRHLEKGDRGKSLLFHLLSGSFEIETSLKTYITKHEKFT